MKEMPYMNTHLPADLEQFVQAKVRSGRFTSSDEAITAAVRLLRQQEEAEEARVLEGIRQGLDDMRAGRTQPLAEAFADIRRDLDLPTVHEIPHRAGRNRQGGYSRPGPMATRVHIARRRHEMAGWTVQGHGYPSNAAPERPGCRRERQVPRGNPRIALWQTWQAETQASDHLHPPRGHRLRPLCPSHRP